MCTHHSRQLGARYAAAAELAARFRVFPLDGKRPLTPHGCHDATTDPRTVAAWWQRWPHANIGVATGETLAALDVDGEPGADSLHELVSRHGALPATWTVKTGGGGSHYYFATAETLPCSAGRVGAGLDVRGTGGYVVGAGSVHPDTGALYEWEVHPDELPVAAIPRWLLEAARAPRTPAGKVPAHEWQHVAAGARAGERNMTLARVVGHLAAHRVNDSLVAELSSLWAQHRCRPPMAEDEAQRVIQSIMGRELKRRAE